MRSFSCCRGQAAVEYVAAVTLVWIVVAGAAAAARTAGAPPLAGRVTAAIRHGICAVSGALCTPAEARAAGLAPCAVRVRTGAERLGGRVAVVRLGRNDAVIVERLSDGRVRVSFADGWRAGAAVGVGFRVHGADGRGAGGAGVSFQAGRTYELADDAAAQRFLATYARDETLGGEGRRLLRGLARGICRRCAQAVGMREERELPPPAARYEEAGAYAEAMLSLGVSVPTGRGTVPVGVSGEAERISVVGRRVAGARRTHYLRLRRSAVGRAGLMLATLEGGSGYEAVLELTEEGGRPVEARFRAVADVAWEAGAVGASVDIGDIARLARGAVATRRGGDRGGARLDAQIALDLRDEANRRALAGVLSPGASPMEWDDRVAALGRRLDVAGAVDVVVSTTTASREDHGVEATAAAVGYERTVHARRLLAAWSRRGGGGLRRREDCEAAAGMA